MLGSSVKPKTLILADENGTPHALVDDPDGKLRSGLGSYQVLSTMPDLLVLRKQAAGDVAGPPGRVLMAGEILGDSTIIDVVSVIVSSRWAGTLHVHGADARRTFGFDKTALVHASSDHPEDRLDKIMFRIGVLTPAQAEAVMREVKPGQRFGEVLIERGLIERKRLYEHLQRQMAEIFFSAVLEREGAYLFCVFDQAAPAPSLIAHLPAQQLLMSAAERLDQVRDFQKLISDEQMRPELEPEVDLTKQRPRSRLALSYCDGQRTLRGDRQRDLARALSHPAHRPPLPIARPGATAAARADDERAGRRAGGAPSPRPCARSSAPSSATAPSAACAGS